MFEVRKLRMEGDCGFSAADLAWSRANFAQVFAETGPSEPQFKSFVDSPVRSRIGGFGGARFPGMSARQEKGRQFGDRSVLGSLPRQALII